MAGFLQTTINLDFVPAGVKVILSPVRTETYDGETLPKGTQYAQTTTADPSSVEIPVKGAGSVEYLCELKKAGTRIDSKKFYVAYSAEAQNLSDLWAGGTAATDTTNDYIDSRTTDERLTDLITPLIPAPIPGNDGQDGEDGADGLSAYEVAVANGFVGTEAEWLLSLKGAKGDTGDTGTVGVRNVLLNTSGLTIGSAHNNAHLIAHGSHVTATLSTAAADGTTIYFTATGANNIYLISSTPGKIVYLGTTNYNTMYILGGGGEAVIKNGVWYIRANATTITPNA